VESSKKGGAAKVFSNSGQGAGCRTGLGRMNTHIRFYTEESDLSDFNDSIHIDEGAEQRSLKLRQRNREKKNSGSLDKKQLMADMEAKLAVGLKLGKKDKKSYRVSALHRRAVSQIEGGDEEYSEKDACVGRSLGEYRQLSYSEAKGSQGSGIGFLNRGYNDDKELKRLAAKKVLKIQKGSRVSYYMKEGPIIEKLVALEEASVNYKISREEDRWCP
jgi:hypothetical protein